MTNSLLLQTALAVTILLAGCGRPEPAPSAAELEAKKVKVVLAATSDIAETYQATGSVRSVTRSVLASQVMGTVRQVAANVGDRVSSGQVMVSLTAPQLGSGQAQAQAAVAEAESALPEADAAIQAARASLALATATHQRMSSLLAKASISRQEMDEAEARLRQAQAAVEGAEARRRQAEARRNQSRQALDSAQTMASYLTLRAPFAGTVTERNVQPGMVASPGAPLLTLERDGAYEVEVAVDEGHAVAMKAGLELTAFFSERPEPLTLRITSIVPAIDPGSRTLLVRAQLPPGANWRSGQFARAKFRLGSRRALTIPQVALVTQGQLQFVVAVEAGRAVNRMVTTAPAGPGLLEVLSGLREGDTIVSPVPADLRDGRKVVAAP